MLLLQELGLKTPDLDAQRLGRIPHCALRLQATHTRFQAVSYEKKIKCKLSEIQI